MNRKELFRWSALGGVIGPVVFVTGWLVIGLTLNHYSPINQAISELARLGRPSHKAMTVVFITFGILVGLYSITLRSWLGNLATTAALITGLGTIGVALAPLGTPLSDKLHLTFAATTYAALAICPLTASRFLTGRNSRISAFTGIAIASTLLISFAGPHDLHGLFQRLGLTIGDIWFFTTAMAVLTRPQLLNQHSARP